MFLETHAQKNQQKSCLSVLQNTFKFDQWPAKRCGKFDILLAIRVLEKWTYLTR